ncbi:AsmA family protein [Algoriphagus chordae]|uniref:AsmA protein n=1 Tax=Algoriphagus chordae TaxID=237019 RepID=A0A2W7QE98_9BACT|nr:AsmA-like C-terminal region-containing protein [Algoriphagus chordae]PZX46523.1 AsmA protein [Algoriphagus chordae]
MKQPFYKGKTIKYILGFLGLFFIFLLTFPLLFKEKIQLKLQQLLDNQLQTEVQFSKVGLTFFRHFPSLTVTMDELFIAGSAPFEHDTLLYTKQLDLGINIPSLFSDNYKVDKLYLNEAVIKVLRDNKGLANFDILKPSTDSTATDTSSGNLDLEIEGFFLKNSYFLYQDISLDMVCEASQLNYKGGGNLADDILTLGSDIDIQEFRLVYEDFPIFNRNRVSASLQTLINTESTELTFVRNELKINDLPVNFVGKLEFLEGGYDMNFVLESFNAQLKDMLSVIPADLMPSYGETTIRGTGDIVGSFQGLYLPAEDQMPALVMNLQVRDGFLEHKAASTPIENLRLSMNVMIPKLDPDLTRVDIDSIGFSLGEGFLKGNMHLAEFNPMQINADLDAKLDLGVLNEALGTESLDFRGMLDLQLKSRGFYVTSKDPKSLREPKYITSSVPVFSFSAGLSEGYLKWAELPEAIKDISIDLQINSPDSLPEHIGVDFKKIHFQVLDQISDGYFAYNKNRDQAVDAEINSRFNLADIPKFYPLDSGYQLRGMLNTRLVAKGNFNKEQKTIPIIDTDFQLTDGYILTPYHSEAIKDLRLSLKMQSSNTAYSDLKFQIEPIQFNFGNNPFTVSANLENLDDIRYDLSSKGRLDLGELYKVFGQEDMSIDGYLITDVNLKGLQSDAMNGRLQNLHNQGTIDVEKILVRTQLLPEPVRLEKGKLEFDQDKISFQNFLFGYEKNEIKADGYLNNYMGYLTNSDQLLKGKLELASSYINLDDFAFFGESNEVEIDSIGEVTGVIVPPMNMDLTVKATVDSMKFGELKMKNFKGEINTKPGQLSLNKTSFEIIGASVEMTGKYLASTPFAANFDYQIDAKEFDIHRAYEEIPLFREMASFAEYASGQASLTYELAGRLNANMEPVLPSIVGEGTLGLKAIKLKGFKLMNSIAKETENEELEDPELNDVEIQTSIANNLMTIPRTKMRIAGFRPRFEGQVSLDGDMSIGLRLGLPPLGIFGVPIKITGNAEDYKMQVGKVSKEDELEEIVDDKEN